MYADFREIRKAFVSDFSDTRFSDYDFAKATEQADNEVKDKLRPQFLIDRFELSYYLTSTSFVGTATAGSGSNSIEDSSQSWTADEFIDTVDCEVVLYNGTTQLYIANITDNGTDTLTISSIDGADITVLEGWKYKIRKKNPALNTFVIAIGVFNVFVTNRVKIGINEIPEQAQYMRDKAFFDINVYLGNVSGEKQAEFESISASESVTFNGSEYQYLNNCNLEFGSVVVTKNSTTYRDYQGFQVNHNDGTIKWVSSSRSSVLGSSDTVTVAYKYYPRKADSRIFS